ncbi:MAG: amino acid adenylation domain-containing protein, partial [bacterium]|nr:amino acid adenylation domain-containing protein [bacterium]
MIIKKFEEQMERFCDRTAVKTAARELTYRQLDEYVNRVAHAIIAKSAGEQQVALLFEHGIFMIVGALGTLKADKTYVPMDISYPEKRLLYLLENSGTDLILTDGRNLSLAQALSGRAGGKPAVLNIEDMDGKFPITPVQREVSEERNAYILYTSGSTGKPKGVYQTLRNMWYYIRNWIERFSITEFDRMSLLTSFTHDGAVQDIFAALLSGACLYPYSMKNRGSVEELYMLLVKERITIWHSVPSLYRFFAETLTEKDLFYDIRWVLLGGEPLREHDLTLFKSYFPKALLANVYGQTESSVSTICTISREDTFDDVSLGRPLDKTEILLVDEEGDIVETMGVGEVVVSCDHIAPGYWRDPGNSESVFTRDDELGRLYWTGDMGRLTAEGFIKVMGRKDFQVKVRGFRVETGEIETVLLRHNSVKEVITIAKPDEEGDNYLCAYIVANETIAPEELRRYLALELPDYMVPRYFMFLEKMPLNPTGKIDRRQLPEPEEAMVSESVYEAPSNETEKRVAEIWQEVLGVEKVGIHDNFIELGGHSLLVISIISRIHQAFDVELQLSDVFENPTVKELSLLIAASEENVFSTIESTEKKEYYPVTSDQKRMFVLDQFEGIGVTYNLMGIMALEGNVNPQRFEQTFQALVRRHEAFRTSFRLIAEELVQVIHEKVDF